MTYNTQLTYTLARANHRYSRIALEMRKGLEHRRRMHHIRLRLRAAWIGLQVDVKAAMALNHSEVSKIPKPILDTNPSPGPATPLVLRIPPIIIPARAVRDNVGNNWDVPGAPLMKTRDLPPLSPQGPGSLMPNPFCSVTPQKTHTPLTIKLRGKRKLNDIEDESCLSYKDAMRRRWELSMSAPTLKAISRYC